MVLAPRRSDDLMSVRASASVRDRRDHRMCARVAVSVMPLENRREALIGLATAADRLGYDGFYLPETWAYDVTVLLAEAALRTERVGLGTGILGVWSRSAATIAMAASTLSA